jgi:hypothetical protein
MNRTKLRDALVAEGALARGHFYKHDEGGSNPLVAGFGRATSGAR